MMRPVSFYAAFAAHIVVAAFAITPAGAAPVFVNADMTITTDASGDSGGASADDDDGTTGGAAVIWDVSDADVIFNAGLAFTGGPGADGGFDAANDGGNAGGDGGNGFAMWKNGATATAADIVIGGGGGDGSAGGAGGAADTAGGIGGVGGHATYVDGNGVHVTFANSGVFGGNGGDGGDAGDAAGDAADTAAGAVGGAGGHGIHVFSGTGTIISLTNTDVLGGNGGVGGDSLANATNAKGGNGGVGIVDLGTNTTITIGVGSLVAGGDGGANGTGGTGGVASIDGAGISLGGLDATLTNHGTILGSDTGVPAALSITGNTTLVDNFGAIGATSGHAGRGILLTGGSTLATLHNHAGGLIQSTANHAAVSVTNGATIATFINEGSISAVGSAVDLDGIVGSFTNSGTIHSLAGSGLAINNADVADTFVNTGGTISSTFYAGIAIYAQLGPSGIVFDGGHIVSSDGNAIYVNATQTGAVGVKDATVDGVVRFTDHTATFNVRASALNGDVVFDAGTNNVNFLSGSSTVGANTQFSSDNILFFSVLAGADVISNAAQTDGNSAITQLTTIAGSTLTLNEDFLTDDKVVNEGHIEIAAGKILTTKLLSGAGDYVFNVSDASTVAAVNAQGAGSSLDFTGATLEIKLTDPSALLANGVNLQLAEDLNGNAILGVTNGTLLADNSALMNFLLFRGDASEIGLDDGLLFAQVQLALLADIAALGDDPNAAALGAALDEIGLAGDTGIDDLMLALATLPTNDDVNDVLDSLLPETDGVAYDIATDAGDQVLDVASRRIDGLRGTSVASREYKLASTVPVRSGISPDAGRFWGQAFGRAVEQSRHDYNDGYDAGTYGLAIGADTTLSGGKALLGAAFAYADTGADGNGANRTDTSVGSYQLVLYGDRQFIDAVYAKGLIAYGWHQNDIVRHDVGGVVGNNASGAYDATQVNARAEIGRAFVVGPRLMLIPRFDLSYAAYDPDSYSETGVGGLGLAVDGESLQSFRLGAGILARWDVQLESGALLQPELRVNYRRDLSRERFETTSEFIGAPGIATFRTQGVEPPADILNLGVGAVLATAGGIDLRASYDLELKESYTAHGGYIRASLPF